jgi:hypothetical protein
MVPLYWRCPLANLPPGIIGPQPAAHSNDNLANCHIIPRAARVPWAVGRWTVNGGGTEYMSFQVVIAKERRVCTCICSYHHIMNAKRRCLQFIDPGEEMAEDSETTRNARRCMPCAEQAGVLARVRSAHERAVDV